MAVEENRLSLILYIRTHNLILRLVLNRETYYRTVNNFNALCSFSKVRYRNRQKWDKVIQDTRIIILELKKFVQTNG